MKVVSRKRDRNRRYPRQVRWCPRQVRWSPRRVRRILICLLIAGYLPGQVAHGQTFHSWQESINIVNGCARLQPDLFSASVNPAVLASTQSVRMAASSENAWSLPGLTFSRLVAAIPVSNGAIGAGVQYAGDRNYNESGIDFGYGLTLGKAGMGILMNYRQFSSPGYQPVSSGAAVFGLRLPLFSNLLTGLSFSVPFVIARSKNPADKPAGNYRIEMGFLASDQVSFFAAWVKTDGLSAAAEIGIDYAFASHFFFVAGLHGRTGAPFGKAGWAKNGWRLVIYTAYQAPLGFSPGLGFSWDRPAAKVKTSSTEKEGAR